MPAIGTGNDITYALPGPSSGSTGPWTGARMTGPGRVMRQVKVTFPNNGTNNTYPTGGVPLEVGKLGFPRGVVSISVLGRTTQAAATNVYWEWNGDGNAPKLLGYEIDGSVATDTQPVELDNTDVLATNGAVLFLDVEGA